VPEPGLHELGDRLPRAALQPIGKFKGGDALAVFRDQRSLLILPVAAKSDDAASLISINGQRSHSAVRGADFLADSSKGSRAVTASRRAQPHRERLIGSAGGRTRRRCR